MRGFCQNSVVIPFDIGDVVFAQQCIDLTKHVVEGTFVREVENLLVSKRRGNPTTRMQNPIWMLAIQITIGVHHLAFEPEPKLHAAGLHDVDKG